MGPIDFGADLAILAGESAPGGHASAEDFLGVDVLKRPLGVEAFEFAVEIGRDQGFDEFFRIVDIGESVMTQRMSEAHSEEFRVILVAEGWFVADGMIGADRRISEGYGERVECDFFARIDFARDVELNIRK